MAYIKINYNAKSEELFRREEKLANAKSKLQKIAKFGFFPGSERQYFGGVFC